MNTADILALPARTLDILKQIEKCKAGTLSQSEASRALRLSERHFRKYVSWSLLMMPQENYCS